MLEKQKNEQLKNKARNKRNYEGIRQTENKCRNTLNPRDM